MAPSPDAPDAGAAGRESEAGVPVAAAALERLRALLKRLQQVDPRQPLDSLLEELAGLYRQRGADVSVAPPAAGESPLLTLLRKPLFKRVRVGKIESC